MNQKKTGEFLKQLRKEKNMTQEQLAEKFYVSGRTVSRWETGNNMPDLGMLVELADFYDVDINYYAQFNFTGFKRLIDAVGGISVYSEISFYSTNEGIYFEQGINHLNGEQALAFVRERKQFSGGDRVRGQHQMQVIDSLLKINTFIGRIK